MLAHVNDDWQGEKLMWSCECVLIRKENDLCLEMGLRFDLLIFFEVFYRRHLSDNCPWTNRYLELWSNKETPAFQKTFIQILWFRRNESNTWQEQNVTKQKKSRQKSSMKRKQKRNLKRQRTIINFILRHKVNIQCYWLFYSY